MELDNKLDQVKYNLATQEDFNLVDAFRIFDKNSKGYVTTVELIQGLTALNVGASNEDLVNFMKRYDRLDQGGKLRYTDFCDAFLPMDP